MEKPNRNYWLHRITGGANALPVALRLLPKDESEVKNPNRDFYISIGWSDFSSDKFVHDVLYGDISIIEEQYKKYKYPKSRNRWCLWRFIHEMKKGDYVVVPSWGVFGVYEIADDTVLSNQSYEVVYGNHGEEAPVYDGKRLQNKQGKTIDLGFYRRVIPVEIKISRTKYADPKLVRRMKIRQTNTELKGFGNIIDNAILSYRDKKPINLKANILEKSLKDIFLEIKNSVTPERLEEVVGWYLESQGADWIDTPAKNASPTEKGDADRIACYEKFKLVILVQVKKHEDTTGKWAVQQIQSYCENYPKERGYTYLKWVVSTCDQYSEEAIELAKKYGIRLIDGKEFTQMILENGLKGMEI